MPATVDVEALFRKHLGRETADVLLAKVDEMVKMKKPAAEIEKAVTDGISMEIEKQVATAVIAKIGPIQPIKVSTGVQSAVKTSVSTSIKASIKVSSGVQVKVTPPIMVKGGPGK